MEEEEGGGEVKVLTSKQSDGCKTDVGLWLGNGPRLALLARRMKEEGDDCRKKKKKKKEA